MFRNVLAAALRHLARSRLYTAVSVLGLAVGLCVALLTGLVIHNQYSYDHDVAGHERTYLALTTLALPGQAPLYLMMTTSLVGRELQRQFPQVEAVGSVIEQQSTTVILNGRSWQETVYWVDAQFPEVLPPSGHAGDVAAALRAADGLVLSRDYARRFFGRDAPLGETLSINGHPMVVRAVIEDPRPNATHAVRNMLASGAAGFSPFSAASALPGAQGGPGSTNMVRLVNAYVRLKPGADERTLLQQMQKVAPSQVRPGQAPWPQLVRLDRINAHEGLHPGFRSRMVVLAILGAVVLLIAVVNFANLQTARATLRAREVAIRGLVGAGRRTLIVQFLGEALIYAATATLLAVALAEWMLPRVNAFLDTGAVLDYRREPLLPAVLAGTTVLLGLIAGAWPAFVQSRFRPAMALRGGAVLIAGGGAVRQVLVTLQFALLIALAICAGVVYRQHEFALNEALRVDHDQVLLVLAPRSALFADELRNLPGVRAVTRAGLTLMGKAGFGGQRSVLVSTLTDRDGQSVALDTVVVDFDLFDFYGLKPFAGQLSDPDGQASHNADSGIVEIVINEAMNRKFGFGSPAAAIGKSLPIALGPGVSSTRIVAVVPDFSMGSVQEPIAPTVYIPPGQYTQQWYGQPNLVNVRLAGREIPETLEAIDRVWKSTGNASGPGATASPLRMFLDEHFQRNYLGMRRQFQAFGICALIAVILSSVGLFALTAATAERRTKEIGIRKALGADTGDVLKLLLWQFSRPVVWANLLAWPVAGYLMQRWLAGFAYHVDLPIWLFPLTALGALLIALATVTTQSLAVARSKPVTALRHE